MSNIGKNKLNINANTVAHTIPPIDPSIDFLGEIRGFNLCFPNLHPINKANTSTAHVVKIIKVKAFALLFISLI